MGMGTKSTGTGWEWRRSRWERLGTGMRSRARDGNGNEYPFPCSSPNTNTTCLLARLFEPMEVHRESIVMSDITDKEATTIIIYKFPPPKWSVLGSVFRTPPHLWLT